jgi:2-dehydro-3-deoxygluconokinase
MQVELVTLGEVMVRLSPPNFQRIEQTRLLDVHVGGAEMNVAIAAARLGLSTGFVTRLTDNPLGRLAQNKVREHGVDVHAIAWTKDDRVGTYYVEFGASPRANAVIYDRGGSAMARTSPGEFDWQEILAGAKLFHTSGITPALSPACAHVTLEAVEAATKMGVKVSLDLNYRAKLWSQERAREVMERLVERADVLITTEEDTLRVFGIEGSDYREVARKLAQRFSLEYVAITLRETPSVWRNQWTAIVYDAGHNAVLEGPSFDIELVDRVGAGDSFAGGFLYGLVRDGAEMGLRYGVAVSALKQTHPGDVSWVTRDEAERVLQSRDLRIAR